MTVFIRFTKPLPNIVSPDYTKLYSMFWQSKLHPFVMGTSEAEADGMLAVEDKGVTFLQSVWLWVSVSQVGPSERHSALMTHFRPMHGPEKEDLQPEGDIRSVRRHE